jgi:hypothetical protein
MLFLKDARPIFLYVFMGDIAWISRFAFSSVAPAIKDDFGPYKWECPPMVALALWAAGYALVGILGPQVRMAKRASASYALDGC